MTAPESQHVLTSVLLSDGERQSVVWLKIKDALEKRLAFLRVLNEGRRSEEDRHYIIGNIEEVKRMLRMGEATPVVVERPPSQ